MPDNPNAFKHWFDAALVERTGRALSAIDPDFDARSFTADATDGLDALELKDRVRHIADALHRHLPADFPSAVARLLAALPPPLDGTDGTTEPIGLWPFCHYVEVRGLDHPELALSAMRELTQRFSAEFAVRPYFLRHPEQTIAFLSVAVDHPSPHVRRWVSEGTRPRLPWGVRIQPLIDDPSPTLPLLERLRKDPEEYVRRSVANHLNDIAKDHPELVVDITSRWWADASTDEQRMIRHALRTLVKQGHAGALAVLGFGAPTIEVGPVVVHTAEVVLGGSLEFSVELRSTADADQHLLVDYVVHHVRANGSRTPKVFKWTRRTVRPGQSLVLSRTHPMRPVTTRRYYAGEHRIEVQVNGQSVGDAPFDLALTG